MGVQTLPLYSLGRRTKELVEGVEVMNDLISREALNKAIEEEYEGVCVYDVSGSEVVRDFQTIVDIQPAVDAIPVEWLEQRRFETSYNGCEPDIDLNYAFCTVMNEWQSGQRTEG